MSNLILCKNYCGEEIADVDRDVSECFDIITVDEHGFHKGEFKITVEWIADGECWCTGFKHQTSCKNHWANDPKGEVPY
jgi:hypothetical protein